MIENKCNNLDCPCNKPRTFWVQIDPDSGNPIGICWAYYTDDRPIEGNWIKVVDTGEKNV